MWILGKRKYPMICSCQKFWAFAWQFHRKIPLCDSDWTIKSLSLQVVSQGAISAPMYSLKGPSMIQSLYPTAFPLKHQQKVIALDLATSYTYHHLNSHVANFAGLEACSRFSRIRFAVYPYCCSCKWAVQGSQISWTRWSGFLSRHWIIEIKVAALINQVIRFCCTPFSLNNIWLWVICIIDSEQFPHKFAPVFLRIWIIPCVWIQS